MEFKEFLITEAVITEEIELLKKRYEKLKAENEKLKQQLKQQQYKRELDYGQGYKMYATEKGVFADVDI